MANADYRIHELTHGLLTFQSSFRLLAERLDPDTLEYGLAAVLDARLTQLLGEEGLEGLEKAVWRHHPMQSTVKAA